MNDDLRLIEQQHQLLLRLTALTAAGSLRWEKQKGSLHRFADWDGILLILGPGELFPNKAYRYLHITPLFSLKWLEINSGDPKLHDSATHIGCRSSDKRPTTDKSFRFNIRYRKAARKMKYLLSSL